MFKEAKEITIDDIIEFIIKNCDDTELMDKINKTSFPFTTKYLNSNNWKKESTQRGYSYNVPNVPMNGTITLCNGEEILSPKEE